MAVENCSKQHWSGSVLFCFSRSFVRNWWPEPPTLGYSKFIGKGREDWGQPCQWPSLLHQGPNKFHVRCIVIRDGRSRDVDPWSSLEKEEMVNVSSLCFTKVRIPDIVENGSSAKTLAAVASILKDPVIINTVLESLCVNFDWTAWLDSLTSLGKQASGINWSGRSNEHFLGRLLALRGDP
jgi:hypothetical protein